MSQNPIGVSQKGVKNASNPETYREKYIPDLSGFISVCDANYAKLMKLLPCFEKQDQQKFGLAHGESLLGQIEIEITERCKYTTTLNLKQYFATQSPEAFLSAPQMQVRLYHDAMMAEVLSFQGINKIKAAYIYPNETMHQKAEKALCNQFLSDWLNYCLRFAYASEVKVFEPLSEAAVLCVKPLEDSQLQD